MKPNEFIEAHEFKEVHTGEPPKKGHYRVWELVSGLSVEAYWNSYMKQWEFPESFALDDNYEPEVEYWSEL